MEMFADVVEVSEHCMITAKQRWRKSSLDKYGVVIICLKPIGSVRVGDILKATFTAPAISFKK